MHHVRPWTPTQHPCVPGKWCITHSTCPPHNISEQCRLGVTQEDPGQLTQLEVLGRQPCRGRNRLCCRVACTCLHRPQKPSAYAAARHGAISFGSLQIDFSQHTCNTYSPICIQCSAVSAWSHISSWHFDTPMGFGPTGMEKSQALHTPLHAFLPTRRGCTKSIR